jgi:putative transposase
LSWHIQLARSAIIIKPSTLLRFHNALKKRKYPMSDPFVERLIGSSRRELLDQTFFWTVTDLENKLRDYRRDYNKHRCHSSRAGATPVDSGEKNIVDINRYRWKKHCRDLFELPTAA